MHYIKKRWGWVGCGLSPHHNLKNLIVKFKNCHLTFAYNSQSQLTFKVLNIYLFLKNWILILAQHWWKHSPTCNILQIACFHNIKFYKLEPIFSKQTHWRSLSNVKNQQSFSFINRRSQFIWEKRRNHMWGILHVKCNPLLCQKYYWR
jgi:hypothetical protein